MSPWRAALLGGLFSGLPFGIWLLGALHPAPTAPILLPAYRALLWSQGLALALLLPALASACFWRRAGALILLQAVPWPLLPLLVRTGTVPLPALLTAQAALMVGALLVAGLWHLLGRIGIESWRNTALAALQGALLLGLLAGLGPAAGELGL